MNDFWNRKLARPAATQLPAPGYPQPGQRPWWDQSPPPPPPLPHGYPPDGPPGFVPEGAQVLYDAQGNAVLVGRNGQVLASHQPQEASQEFIERNTRSARKAKSETGICPECSGNNYTTVGSQFTRNGQVETRRCFDCGFPVLQRASGMAGLISPGAKADGAARQLSYGGKENNFVPVIQGNNGPVLAPAPHFAAEQGGPGR